MALLAAVAIVLIVNPVGFSGGGNDNGRYLDAARCWREHGACLPGNHWEGRWPVFLPISWLTSLLGESRTTVAIWPLAASLVAIFLFVRIGTQLAGRQAAFLAALLLISIPIFGVRLLTPGVEAVELCFLVAGALAMLSWKERPAPALAFCAGLCFGLGFQVRETALVGAALILLAMLLSGARPRWSDYALAAAGFALPLAIEFAVYQLAAGDPLFRRRLSLNHAQIYSSELASTVDRSRSPLFNPDFIAGWSRDSGIRIHWLIDGPLNLVVSPMGGFSLLLTPILLLVAGRKLDRSDRRLAWLLLAMAAAYVAILVYVLAMDPKARVMLPALAASSLALGMVLVGLYRAGSRPLAAATLLSVLVAGILIVSSKLRPVWADRQARDWAARYPDLVEVEGQTRLMLTLLPEVRAMPRLDADRPLAMIIVKTDCADWVAGSGLPVGSLSVAGERRMTLYPTRPGEGAYICLFRYHRPVTGQQMRAAVAANWSRKGDARSQL